MKMNRVVSIVLILTLFMLLISGCGQKTDLPDESVSEASDPIILRVALETNPGQARNNSVEQWAKLVHEYTNGEIQFDIYPSAQLGQPNEVMEGLRIGTVDLTVQGSGLVGGVVPAFNVIFLPYRWRNYDHLSRFLESDMFKEKFVQPLLDLGIRYITSWERTPRHLTTKDKAVTTPDDLKSMKVRVPEAAAAFETWRALGANVQPVAWGEVYSALQQGVVDAAEAPIEALMGISIFEVCKKLILTGHVYDAEVVMVAESTYQKLTPEQQEILFRAAREAREWTSEKAKREEQEYIEKIKEMGVEIINPDVDAFMAKTADTVKKFSEELVPGIHQYILDLQ